MSKPKLAIIVDMPGWAFDIGAKLIKKEVEDKYNVEIFYEKMPDKKYTLYEILELTKSFDIVHFLWRKILLDFETDKFKNELKENNKEYNDYVTSAIKRISTGVYDHMFLNIDEQKKYNKIFSKYSNKYFVCSKKLYDIYSNIENIPNPWGIIMDTVDSEKFVPKNLERFSNIENRQLNVGWVGNNNWNIKDGKGIDYKGFHTILKPAIEELKQTLKIDGIYADKNIKLIPNDEMPEYYSNIDIFVCCSFQEGTPRPVIEAMCCGVPIIATNVGVTSEIFGENQQKYILQTRNKETLKEKIKELYLNRKELAILSKENIKQGKKLTSENRRCEYLQYFEDFCKNS